MVSSYLQSNVMMNGSIEEQLLLCCARTSIDDDINKQIKLLIYQGVDWDELIDMAISNQLIPLLYRNLQQICSESIPVNVINQLKIINHESIAFSVSFTVKLQEILEYFAAENIPVIPYKGPVLAVAVYGDLCLRQFTDIDLFVASKDVVRSGELLVSQGYYLNRNCPWEKTFTHFYTGVAVDLHEAMAQSYYPFRLDFEHCIEHCQKVNLLDNLVLSFDIEYLLLVLSVQFVKDSYGQTCTLTKVCDISELIYRYPNLKWQVVIDRANSIGCQRILILALFSTHELLGTTLPQSIWDLIENDWLVRQYGKLLASNFFYSQPLSLSFFLFKILVLIEYPLSAPHNLSLLKGIFVYPFKKIMEQII
jgi:hypothetical protein